DPESALAWKEGDFIFHNETLDAIIEQLERWYDIEVDCPPDYRGYRFSGAVSRSKNLSSVLKILELAGIVKFELKERRVTIRLSYTKQTTNPITPKIKSLKHYVTNH